MKINREKTPYDAKTAARDQDFWDWYTRRLLKDSMYRRDFAGQKSFSKLRAAIAGLYVKQGRHSEAAQAFREACMLFPASPEAVFRYAKESLLAARRWDVALEVMDYTDVLDPRNKRTAMMRELVTHLRDLYAQIDSLEAERRKNGALTPPKTFALARAYYSMAMMLEADQRSSMMMQAAQLVRPLVDQVSEPLLLQAISTMLVEARLDADAERCLEKYLRAEPAKDALAWADLAKIQHRTGRRQAAQRSFIAGYRINPQQLFERIQRDQELYEIAVPLFQRRK
jgi:tetratricopeptide (TPR) repeat protein